MTEIWFIRHGETDWNRQRRLQGWQDIPLNAYGREQARQLAQRLRLEAQHTPFNALYSSDLVRAHATAAPAGEQLDLRVRTEPGFRERGFGVLEGLAMDRIHELPPEAAAMWQNRDTTTAPEGGETAGQFKARVIATVEDIAQRHEQERILAFTHGKVLDIIWRQATGASLHAPRVAELFNTGINRVVIARRDWRIVSWGDIAHIKNGAAHDEPTV